MQIVNGGVGVGVTRLKIKPMNQSEFRGVRLIINLYSLWPTLSA